MNEALRVVTINFPTLPYRELLPNNLRSTHWSVRAEVSRIAREEARIRGKEQKLSSPIQLCEVEEVFTVPTKRRADLESCMSACKAWVDGLQDAKIIENDDCFHLLKLSGRVEYEKGVEGTRIVIREISLEGSREK